MGLRFKKIFYRGSESDKNKIAINAYNAPLINATWYYNFCTATAEHTYDAVCDIQCNVCNFIRVPPHSFEWVIDKENNCGVDGYKHEECMVCHTVRNENTVIAPTGEHTFDNSCDTTCNVCEYVRTIEHTYLNECDRDCNVCGEFRKAPHKYDNDCDDTCNLCGSEREIGDHQYTNACDAFCNSCGFERTPSAHIYDNACDKLCNVCGETRTVPNHVYDNACDAFCNVCQAERTVLDHEYSSNCDTICNVCDKIRENTPSHTYTNNCDADCNLCFEIRVPDEHKYANSCDTDCNVCGHIRTVEHTFTNTCDNECDICFESRKAPHFYENNCDADCNLCGKTRVPQEHIFDNSCDTSCNECGLTRITNHTYSNSNDLICNVCYESITPSAPTVASKETTTITLVSVSGCEYSLDGINWQSSTTFSDLTPNTEYTFYQRVKETNVSKQSDISEPLRTKTLKAYTVTLCYNDGSGSEITKTKTEGIALSLGSISSSGYKFLGWSTTPNGTMFISSYSVDADATFYAKWAYECSTCSGKGEVETIEYKDVKCNTCSGDGLMNKKRYVVRCVDCGSLYDTLPGTSPRYCKDCFGVNIGSGYITEYDCETCDKCEGVGTNSEKVTSWIDCSSCNGSGKDAAPQPQAPQPTLKNKGENFVELENIDGVEYSLDGIYWQDSPLFSGLSVNTGYIFYQRYKASSINTVGEASACLYVLTTKAEDTPPRLDILGDVDGKNGINNSDLIMLRRYLAGWSVEINEEAANIDGKGGVNNSDAIWLARHLAGWDGYEIN